MLSARQLRLAYYAVMALLGLGLLFVCRRPGRATSPGGWSKEIALITLATLWFSPVAWSYHPTAAMPALALTLSCRPKHPWLVWITAGMWFLGMVLLGSQLGRAAVSCSGRRWPSAPLCSGRCGPPRLRTLLRRIQPLVML